MSKRKAKLDFQKKAGAKPMACPITRRWPRVMGARMNFLQRLLPPLTRWRRQRNALPPYLTVLDVQTTGSGPVGMITGLVVLRLENDPVSGPTGSFDLLHLAFDAVQEATPRVISSPGRGGAAATNSFARHAAEIWKIIHRAPLIVAPHAARAVSRLDLSFTRAGIPPINRPAFCTVQGLAQFRGAMASWPALPGDYPAILHNVWDAIHIYYRLQGHRISFEPSGELGPLPQNREAVEAVSTTGEASVETKPPGPCRPRTADERRRQR
jgi:hypothetical protein